MTFDLRPMAVTTTAIDGLLRITTKAVTDDRGTVREFFRTSGFAELGVPVPDQWRQVNLTRTRHGAIRGMHGEATAKLIGIASGTAFGAWVDARRDSPTFGAVVTEELAVGVQMFVPAGVCNGFQATSEGGCEYLYCFGEEWQPTMAGVAINPLDPDLGIDWPVTVDADDPSLVSAKDAGAPGLAQLRGGP
jgi:dTDP-4-dehydrorhamnose 3,5-epimerase